MKHKFDREDLQLMINILQRVEFIEFNDRFDSQVCRSVSLQLLQKFVKKLADMKPRSGLTFSPVELLVLRKTLPLITTSDDYAQTFIQSLINKIDPICLSI